MHSCTYLFSGSLFYRLSDGGVPCPAVVQLKKHVLVMQFIGKDGCPAPKLNQVELSEHELGNAYRQVVAVSMYTHQYTLPTNCLDSFSSI